VASPTILVTGATGLNGGEVVRRLSARGVPVRALVRSFARAGGLAAQPNVEIVEGDMAQPSTLAEALRGIERALLISSSDPMMLDVQSNFIEAASAAGVEHVVKLSGIIPELDSPFRFARMHAEIERRLEASGMAFTHLRAGEFMTSYFRQVPSIVAKGALFLPMEDARIASVDVGDIADVAVAVLTDSGHEGKAYPITGPEALSMTEVAEKLSAATGKAIRYVNVAPEDAKSAQTRRRVTALSRRRSGRALRGAPEGQRVAGVTPRADDSGERSDELRHVRTAQRCGLPRRTRTAEGLKGRT
jgi:uncharacterized protein YbjT (DUF2867 family)